MAAFAAADLSGSSPGEPKPDVQEPKRGLAMKSRIFSLIAILCLLAGVVAWSQDTRGTISGRVTDPSGAVIPGAQVVVTNVAMGNKTELTTNADGLYQATFLIGGIYRIEAAAQGFKKIVREGVEVRIAERLEINLALEVGASEQSVTI